MHKKTILRFLCFLWFPLSLRSWRSLREAIPSVSSGFSVVNPSSFFLFLSSFLCGSLFRADLAGETLIFPPAALSDLAKLGPDRIEVRWKPRSIPDGYFPVVEGYYVVYNHENLSLFFGPVPEEKDAIGTQNELNKIRSELIRRNPALSSSTVGRIHIDFGEDLPVSQNIPPPEGFKPVRVLSGNSTLELGKASEGAESESAPTEGPASSTYGIASETDNPEGIPETESANAQNGPPQGAENIESSLEPSSGGSPPEETRNDPGETGILKILSQGSGPSKENPGAEGASSEVQSQSQQSPEGELAGTGNPTSPAPRQTESSESGESGDPSVQIQEPEIEPLRLDAQPATENAQPVPEQAQPAAENAEPAADNTPETVAQSNAPTSVTPGQTESSESGDSGDPSVQIQEPEIEPLRLDAQPATENAEPVPEQAQSAAENAEPAAENAPETVAQSNAPTPANPEKSVSENLQETKDDSVNINQLLKGTLEHKAPMAKEE